MPAAMRDDLERLKKARVRGVCATTGVFASVASTPRRPAATRVRSPEHVVTKLSDKERDVVSSSHFLSIYLLYMFLVSRRTRLEGGIVSIAFLVLPWLADNEN